MSNVTIGSMWERECGSVWVCVRQITTTTFSGRCIHAGGKHRVGEINHSRQFKLTCYKPYPDKQDNFQTLYQKLNVKD